MGLFTTPWGPMLGEPEFFQNLRELADDAAARAVDKAAGDKKGDSGKGGKGGNGKK